VIVPQFIVARGIHRIFLFGQTLDHIGTPCIVTIQEQGQ
jgi:hypothetical protein